MHKIRHVSEIVEIIVQCAYENQPSDLPAIARTCRTFVEPALDVLWSVQGDLGSLFMTLSRRLWAPEFRADDVTWGSVFHHFLNFPTGAGLTFTLVVSRSFDYPLSQLRGLQRSWTICCINIWPPYPSGLEDDNHENEDKDLMGEIIFYSKLFLGPRLVKLVIKDWERPSDEAEALVSVIRQIPSGARPLPWGHIGSSPNLKSLRLQYDHKSSYETSYEDFTGVFNAPHNATKNFPALLEAHLPFFSLELYLPLIRAFHSLAFSDLTISVDQAITHASLQQLISIMHNRIPRHKSLTRIHLSDTFLDFFWNTPQLFHDLTDEIMSELCDAWPNLRHVYMGCQQDLQPIYPRLTLRGLLPLAARSLDWERIYIPLIRSNVARLQIVDWIILDDADKGLLTIAQSLSRIFADVRIVQKWAFPDSERGSQMNVARQRKIQVLVNPSSVATTMFHDPDEE
ncbi:hypothetical protein JAAARDRAFT_200151 [Jaapia argillacea MUCL 33604]|uniref:Uncharacterized protein n=1 Tax=Jaapia argillacea MUCL 33604 TaxID=933084 RepID=A0A067P5T1_9AGAM|nr:hypothetical protein JAAARDRAFT_200151 [Jaapia argillacea MUCL 33604]